MKLLSSKPRVVRFALIAALLCIAIFAYIEYSRRHANRVQVLVSSPYLQMVSIGSYDNLKDGQRAAIQELSRQIKLCPGVAMLEVRWINEDNRSLLYDCELETLQYLSEKSSFSWKLVPQAPFVQRQVEIYGNFVAVTGNNPIVRVDDINEAARQQRPFKELPANIYIYHP